MPLLHLLLLPACWLGGDPGESGDTLVVDSPGDSTADSPWDSPADSVVDPDTGGPCDTGIPWYEDRDGDGHGAPDARTPCDDPLGASNVADDCDDTRETVHEGAPELVTSGRDDDCDGLGGSVAVEDLEKWTAWACFGEGDCHFGREVNLPGDLTGDGVQDIIITTERWDDATGRAFILDGPFPSDDLQVDADSAWGTLLGESNYALYDAIGVGDLDGDGHAELLASGDSSHGATAYLVRGPIPSELYELSQATQIWRWDEGGFEAIVGGPGDLNGDGLSDIVLSHPYAADYAGEAYIMLGPASQSSLDEADTILRGEPDEQLGFRLTPLGDLDADGLADFGVPALSVDQRAYLVLDTPSGTVHPSDAGVTVYRDQDGDSMHNSLLIHALGDLNDDGYEDVGFTEQSYYALVMYGPFGDLPVIDLETSWEAAFVSVEVGSSSEVTPVAPLGDWDGDGHEDIAIADRWYVQEEYRHAENCWAYGVNLCGAGAVFLVAGPVDGGVVELDVQADRIEGVRAGGPFPSALAGGEDLDGDGFPDLVISNEWWDAAYLLSGGGLF